jgi:hypothetical protein
MNSPASILYIDLKDRQLELSGRGLFLIFRWSFLETCLSHLDPQRGYYFLKMVKALD